MILYLILFFIGGFIFVSSIFNSGTYAALVFDRKFHCIEKYMKVQKVTDIVSIIHSISGLAFGAFIMIFSMMHVVISKGGQYDVNLIHTVFKISLILGIIDIAVSSFLSYKYKMRELKENIWKQWETQKTISKDNDHEVNVYRACNRIVNIYPIQILTISVILLLFSFLI